MMRVCFQEFVWPKIDDHENDKKITDSIKSNGTCKCMAQVLAWRHHEQSNRNN